MDELLGEFVAETQENLEELDEALLALEQRPEDKELIAKIFRFVHTIKGTCGFLGLSRLESVAHKGEDLLGLIRDGSLSVNQTRISAIFACLDRIKMIVSVIADSGNEPQGQDRDVIEELSLATLDSTESSPAEAEIKTADPIITGQVQPESAPQAQNTAQKTISVEEVPALMELKRLVEMSPARANGQTSGGMRVVGVTTANPVVPPNTAQADQNSQPGSDADNQDAGMDAIKVQVKRRVTEEGAQEFALTASKRSSEHEEHILHDKDGIRAQAQTAKDVSSSLVFTHKVEERRSEAHETIPSKSLVNDLANDLADGLGSDFKGMKSTTPSANLTTSSEKREAAKSSSPKERKENNSSPSKSVGKELSTTLGSDEGGEMVSSAHATAQTLRISVDVLEGLMTMVSELVLTRNQLMQNARMISDSNLGSSLQRLNFIVSELQEGVMKTRMQPIGNAWNKLPRIVRDLSLELKKEVELEMFGQETELDRQVIDIIRDPLTHMVRNSLDHGIESRDVRLAAGKSSIGRITLNAYHQGGFILIEISDDGAGLPTEKIRNKIIERGLATAEQAYNMTPAQVHRHVFMAGFSTAEKVTAISGRGVGMDVVWTNIDKIGGSIELQSYEGEGTKFTVKIPLTLAIVNALLVSIGEHRFAIPQLSVTELVMVGDKDNNQIEMINDIPVYRLRNKLLPLIRLDKIMKIERDIDEKAKTESTAINQYVIVTSVGSFFFGLLVDNLYDMEEIVIKPLSKPLRKLNLFSGNTILGDGRVVMILDSSGILKTAQLDESLTSTSDMMELEQIDQKLSLESKQEEALLLFKAGNDQIKAVPLGTVARLEEIEMSTIEIANGQQVIQHRGRLMAVYDYDPRVVSDKDHKPLIILNGQQGQVGLIVDQILNITNFIGDMSMKGSEKVWDSLIIEAKATELVNPEWFTSRLARSEYGNKHG